MLSPEWCGIHRSARVLDVFRPQDEVGVQLHRATRRGQVARPVIEQSVEKACGITLALFVQHTCRNDQKYVRAEAISLGAESSGRDL